MGWVIGFHGEAVHVASSTDCKSAGYSCGGSTPSLPTKKLLINT
tara:strand:+ start:1439 stop:1570 length:132 start_codon:yes stop_codon:yes gene_type:complete